MKSRISLFFIFLCVIVHAEQDNRDIFLSIDGLAKKYGYPLEVHNVTTEDGYILTMHRIPHGRGKSGTNSVPVLMMHGIFVQSESFLINAMNNGSPAFILADNNYDVWLGNHRGTAHGRKHKRLDPKDKKFWDFSLHEMGIYDLPAKIDYILKHTKKSKLHYIGHSQGGLVFYIMVSMKPEYQDKIILASLFGPAGYMKSFEHSLIMPLVRLHKELNQLLETNNMYEVLPSGASVYSILSDCVDNNVYRTVCRNAIHLFAGDDTIELDQDILVLLGKFSSSVSLYQLLQFAQIIDSGQFRPMKYTAQKNLAKYGVGTPSNYNIKGIRVPIAMYYSQIDNIVLAKDVEEICEDLPNCVRKFLIHDKTWTHFDFIFSKNISKALMQPVMDLMQRYNLYRQY